MSKITLETIHAKQTELAAMIQQLLNTAVTPPAAAPSTLIEVEGTTIELQPGEHYAGAVLDADGQHLYHLVLMAQLPTDDLAWQAAMYWAGRVGGALPTRQEQSLLSANCKPHLKPEWHWSSETHDNDASFAWDCHFLSGCINYDHKSYEGSAIAVRRVYA